MANIKLTIQHNNTLIEPPIKEGVTIEWERTGSPGKLSFTTVASPNGDVNFSEGDLVCFYYNDKAVFKGYVFKKKCNREKHIEVTAYDQIRYLKNKYTYVFENKTATQIITSMCNDLNLHKDSMQNTKYVIPAIAEENKAALDIVLDVLEETLVNTGEMYVFYDNAGKLTVKNCADMISTTLIMEDTAENFDYSSSIDDETYNSVILYYKDGDSNIVLYTAHSPSTIQKWGNLRYFEEVDTPTIGQNKANMLLNLYNRKTRELKITGAFGDISVRGGTLIPVKLDLGDVVTNNYMLVEKVTHTFNYENHTMDLTLAGDWKDSATEVVSKTYGELLPPTTSANSSSNGSSTDNKKDKLTFMEERLEPKGYKDTYTVTVYHSGKPEYTGNIRVYYYDKDLGVNPNDISDELVQKLKDTNAMAWNGAGNTSTVTLEVPKNSYVYVDIIPWHDAGKGGLGYEASFTMIKQDPQFKLIWDYRDRVQGYGITQRALYRIDKINKPASLTLAWKLYKE